ncbi:MAG: ComEC/Rec2 family competence protein [Lachnospiraceae bacterium]|nr:ComEC/Rec2 family competence protein [Lachnospiraceae bacterium]
MIGGCIYKLLKKMHMKAWYAVLIGIFFIVLYGIMIGMPPSAFRAIVMYAFGLIAPLFLRSHDKLTSMAVAAACLAVAEPLLMYDAGVQLSFLAVLGIVVLYPTFLDIHKHHMKVADGVWVSLAVTYMTLPIIMKSYYEIPMYSLAVNVCVLPFIPLLLGLGLGVIILGPCLPVFATLFAEVIHIVLTFYEKFLSLVARLPGSSYITGAPANERIWIFYIVLVSLIWFVLKIKRRLLIRSLASENAYAEGRQREYVCEQKKIRNRMRCIRCVQAAVMLILFILLLVPERFDDRITFLDVGQGDGFCVELGQEVFMIDGGSTSRENIGNYILLPFLKHQGISEVDGWFLTHPDKDHTSGFEELCLNETMGGISVDTLYIPAVLENEFRNIVRLAEQKEIEVVLLKAGDILQTEKGQWRVLSPSEQVLYEDENAASLVLYLQSDEWDGLFMGDAGTSAEENIAEMGIKDILLLKVGHHGSSINANSEHFIHSMNPQLAVISCGENNVYGHPHKEVLERLETNGSRIWITAADGALTVTFDKKIRMSGP